jgi:hypothetical protein
MTPQDLDLHLFDRDTRIARALGDDTAPVLELGPHPFRQSPGSGFCARCGGGTMHDVHWAERQATE